MAYFAFGTQVSGNIDLGPLPAADPGLPAVRLRNRRVQELPRTSRVENQYVSQGRSIGTQLRGRVLRIRVGDRIQFSLLIGRGLVLCMSTADVSVEQTRYWFLQKALPAFLLFDGGVEILHGSAVEIGKGAAAFLAQSGTGKSTMVAYCVSRGHALIADEHLMLEADSFKAVPTIPYARPFRQMECLGESVSSFCEATQPLTRLYLLEKALPDAPVSIEPLLGKAAAIALYGRQQFGLKGVADSEDFSHLLADRLRRLSSLATSVSVKVLRVPRSMERLPDVYDAIRNDMR